MWHDRLVRGVHLVQEMGHFPWIFQLQVLLYLLAPTVCWVPMWPFHVKMHHEVHQISSIITYSHPQASPYPFLVDVPTFKVIPPICHVRLAAIQQYKHHMLSPRHTPEWWMIQNVAKFIGKKEYLLLWYISWLKIRKIIPDNF